MKKTMVNIKLSDPQYTKEQLERLFPNFRIKNLKGLSQFYASIESWQIRTKGYQSTIYYKENKGVVVTRKTGGFREVILINIAIWFFLSCLVFLNTQNAWFDPVLLFKYYLMPFYIFTGGSLLRSFVWRIIPRYEKETEEKHNWIVSQIESGFGQG